MSETINDGGSAFPSMLPGGIYQTTGMSLLDYFAGQAIIGLVQSCAESAFSDMAEDAYQIAEKMLTVREAIDAVES